ncbi:MAG: hypothetical protein FGF52_04655 [Candidatus Brockarchaeota archaeon]|nr:hypothetical protein [Candidatus Brockarchaeota archaeon]
MKKTVAIILLCLIIAPIIFNKTIVEAYHGSKCLKIYFNRKAGDTGGVQVELDGTTDLSRKRLSVWMKVPREAADANIAAKIFIFDGKWKWADAGPHITSFGGREDQWVELVWDLSKNPPSETGFPECDPTNVRIVGVLIGEWAGGNWSGYIYIDAFGLSDPDGQNYQILFDFEEDTEGWTGWGAIETVETVSVETPIPTPSPSGKIYLYYDFSSSRGRTFRLVDVNSDGKYDYRIDICNWNINSAKGGRINMTYDISTTTLITEADIWGAQPQNYVNGYPEIYVGRKPWDGQYANGLGLNFPYKVSDLVLGVASLKVSFSVDLQRLNPDMNFNIAADAWLVDERHAFNPGSGLSIPHVEVMVWVFRSNLGPAGSKVGEEDMSGRAWEVWRKVETNNATYIAIIPKGWSLRKGSISYDVSEVMRIAKKYAPFDISDYYLVGWELGTEWGTKNSGGVAQFRCSISNYTVTETPAPTPRPTSTPTSTPTPTPTSTPTPTPSFGEFAPYIILVIVLIISILEVIILYKKKKELTPATLVILFAYWFKLTC